jgi:hypothetical protein
MIITVELVRALLRAQFPQWSGLNLRATDPPGQLHGPLDPCLRREDCYAGMNFSATPLLQ